MHSKWGHFYCGLFSTFLRAERNVRFNSLALAPSISASTTNSSPAFIEGALRGQLLKSILDRPGVRACRELQVHVAYPDSFRSDLKRY